MVLSSSCGELTKNGYGPGANEALVVRLFIIIEVFFCIDTRRECAFDVTAFLCMIRRAARQMRLKYLDMCLV